jgi:hypothetical protein
LTKEPSLHSYKLYYPVDAECLCCHVIMQFTFRSRSDQVVCASCQRHQGTSAAKLIQRDQDHIGLWRSELGLEKEARAEHVQRLNNTIARRDADIVELRESLSDARGAIKTELKNRPVATVMAWIESENIAEALNLRDAAYRSRDHALSVIWHIDRLHHDHDEKDNHCSCGKGASKCKEHEALERIVEALDRWEESQIDRLKRDLEHGLPRDHPEVLKHGRSYRGLRYGS